MDASPRVSVIIPTYNRAEVLPKAVQSVLDQTYTNFELIIVDDGSSDHTRELVQQFADPRIRYLWQENQERSVARNTGIASSRGEYISFLDSDDKYLPNKLADQVPVLDEKPEIGMVLSGWIEIDHLGRNIRKIAPWENHPAQEYSLKDWLLSPPVHFCVSLVRRCWLETAGGFDPGLTNAEDVDLWFRMIASGCKTSWEKTQVLKHLPHVADSAYYRSNYLRVIENAIAAPSISAQLGITREYAIARVYLVAAFTAYLGKQVEEARQNMMIAAQLNPELLSSESEEVLNFLVSGVWHTGVDDPVAYIRNLYNSIPDSFRNLRKQRHWAFSRAWMSVVLRSRLNQQRGKVLIAVLQTIYYDPSLILNSGILSAFAETLIGHRAFLSLKRLRLWRTVCAG